MEQEPSEGLRARRKLETQREIHQATLELFEAHGVRETTVHQIAERAGVSPRTFFRYFSTKEQAALPGQRRMLRAIDSLVITDPEPAAVLRSVEDMAETVMGADNDPELDEHRRVAKLLARDTDLQSLAASQELVLPVRLRSRLAEQVPETDPATLLLIAETSVAVWRVSWIRWGELVMQGRTADPVAVYRECRERLRSAVG